MLLITPLEFHDQASEKEVIMKVIEQKNSGLYEGKVIHVRLRPKRHSLNYRVFSLLLDIDELPQLDISMKLFGYNRRALVSFYDKDHGNGNEYGLRKWVEEKLDEANLLVPHMSIRILCYPRLFGYVFNPLTLYFCYLPNGNLHAILYEVSNTFKERHTYIIPVGAETYDEKSGSVLQSCAKEFYVSPFMPMDCRYNFKIEPPQDNLVVRIEEEDSEGLLLIAAFNAGRKDLNDQTLRAALLRHPLMTLKVTAGIYWEALKLWWKGVPIYRHKAASKMIASSVISPSPIVSRPDE